MRRARQQSVTAEMHAFPTASAYSAERHGKRPRWFSAPSGGGEEGFTRGVPGSAGAWAGTPSYGSTGAVWNSDARSPLGGTFYLGGA